MPENKIIRDRLRKRCSCCDKEIKVIIYNDRSYRGGHYFGKIPTTLSLRAPRARGNPAEYWECPKCYWKG